MGRDNTGLERFGGQVSLNFAGLPRAETRPSCDVLYFAVLPDRETSLRLHMVGRRLCEQHRLRARPRPAHLLHVSLVGAGEGADPARIARLRQVGERVRRPDFDVVMGIAVSFGRSGRRPLVLRCSAGAAAALTGLRDAICDAAEDLGVGLGGRGGLEPHLTLAYDGAAIPETELDEPVRWPAREVVLVLSEQGRGRHIHLGRWRLTPRS